MTRRAKQTTAGRTPAPASAPASAPAVHRHVGVAERRARMAVRHLLAPGTSAPDAMAVVTALGSALHATDPTTPHISIALRLQRPSRGPLDQILLTDRSVVRHHAMRRTLWILDAHLAGAAHQACTEVLAAREWRLLTSMLRDTAAQNPTPGDTSLGDPETWLVDARARALEVVRELGGCTARELGAAAPELAVPLRIAAGKSYATTQGAHTRLMQNLGFDGAIVRTESVGSWVGGEFRWVLSTDWIPGGFVPPEAARDLDAANRQLAAAYLRSFGPATAADLQWWAGWTATTTRRTLHALGAVPVSVDGEPGDQPEAAPVTAWLLPDDLDPVEPADLWATVLPSLDPTVMGWKQRQWYTGEHGRLGHTVFDRNGNAGNSIVADGTIVGTWVQRPDRSVVLRYLEATPRSRRSLVDESVDRYLACTGDTVVRPRYPAPLPRELLDGAPQPEREPGP